MSDDTKPGCSSWSDQDAEFYAEQRDRKGKDGHRKANLPATSQITLEDYIDFHNGNDPDFNNAAATSPSKLAEILGGKKSEKKKRTDKTKGGKHSRKSSLKINPMIFKKEPTEMDLSSDCENELPLSNDHENSSISVFNFNIEAIVKASLTRTSKFVQLSVTPIVESNQDVFKVPTRESTSSGNFADVSSQTLSSGSVSPSRLLPLLPAWGARASHISSSSSGNSSIPPTTSNQQPPMELPRINYQKCLSPSRVAELAEKWHKHQILFHILDYIDTVVFEKEQEVPPGIVKSKTKRPLPFEDHKSDKKRLRSCYLDPKLFESIMGREVYAQCEDNNYYYGVVSGITKSGLLDIAFTESKSLCIAIEDTISPISCLVCQNVNVSDGPEQSFYSAIVSTYDAYSFPSQFSVISDFGDCTVSATKIFLTEEQAMVIRASTISMTNDDAAISGPSGTQNQASSKDANNVENFKGIVPPTDDTTSNNNNDCTTIMNYSSTDSEQPFCASNEMNTYRYVVGCDMEVSTSDIAKSLLKLKGVGKGLKGYNSDEDRLLGPLTVGTWFNGLSFVLTCSIRNLLAPEARESNSSGDEGSSNTDNENYVFSRVPYVSDRLAQQIRMAGGRVIDTFEELESALNGETYLVTNRPCITARFLKCLVLGVTIACHEWVINCTKKKKRLEIQELPAGWSVEDDRFVTMYQRKYPRPLTGLHVQLAQHQDELFISFWSDICRSLGAIVSTSKILNRRANLVIAEDGYHGVITEEARTLGIPVVSGAWLVQTIIHGARRPYDGHRSYNHLYEEEWE